MQLFLLSDYENVYQGLVNVHKTLFDCKQRSEIRMQISIITNIQNVFNLHHPYNQSRLMSKLQGSGH